MNEKEIAANFRKGVLVLGGVLVVTGAFLLLYFGMLVYQVIHHPQNVALVNYAMERVQGDGRTVYGSVGGQPLELNFSESARRHAFLIVGVLVLAVLAGILKSIISGGVELISFGLRQETPMRSVPSEPELAASQVMQPSDMEK